MRTMQGQAVVEDVRSEFRGPAILCENLVKIYSVAGLDVVALELLSTVVVAVVAGVGLGIATAGLVVPGVGVGQLVGAGTAAAPTAEPSGLAFAALAPAFAALIAIVVLGRSIASPTSVREWIRTAET